jgi:hypothetical protein
VLLLLLRATQFLPTSKLLSTHLHHNMDAVDLWVCPEIDIYDTTSGCHHPAKHCGGAAQEASVPFLRVHRSRCSEDGQIKLERNACALIGLPNTHWVTMQVDT